MISWRNGPAAAIGLESREEAIAAPLEVDRHSSTFRSNGAEPFLTISLTRQSRFAGVFDVDLFGDFLPAADEAKIDSHGIEDHVLASVGSHGQVAVETYCGPTVNMILMFFWPLKALPSMVISSVVDSCGWRS